MEEERTGISPYFRHWNLHFGPVFTCHCLVLPLPSQLPLLSIQQLVSTGGGNRHHTLAWRSCFQLCLWREGCSFLSKTSVAVVGCQTQKTQGLIFCEACVGWEVCSKRWEVLAQSPGTAQLWTSGLSRCPPKVKVGHRPVNPWRSQCLPWKAGAQKALFLESRSDALNVTAASHSSLKSCYPILEMQRVNFMYLQGGEALLVPPWCFAMAGEGEGELGCCPGMLLPLAVAQLHLPSPRAGPCPSPCSTSSPWKHQKSLEGEGPALQRLLLPGLWQGSGGARLERAPSSECSDSVSAHCWKILASLPHCGEVLLNRPEFVI